MDKEIEDILRRLEILEENIKDINNTIKRMQYHVTSYRAASVRTRKKK